MTWTKAMAAFLAAAVLFLGGLPAARAEEAPAEDAAALLRRAKAAEGVESDVAKAMDLYRKAMETGGTTDAARDAAMRLAELQTVRGHAAGAIATLRLVKERFGASLDAATKRKVDDLMARLDPPAAVAPTVVVTSPLDSKILGLLARLDDVAPDQRHAVEAQVRQALDVVGKDALPTLERVMNTERLDKAQFAAREYARIGQEDAVAGLERTIREGDGFARGAAIDALGRLPTENPAASAAAVAAIDRLLAVPALEARRSALVGMATRYLSDGDLLKRHETGGPDSATYLLAAVQRGSPAGIERAVGALRRPGDVPPHLLPALTALAGLQSRQWNGSTWWVQGLNTSIDTQKRLDVLRLVTAQPPTQQTTRTATTIAAAVAATAEDAVAAQAALEAWRHALSAESRTQATRMLLDFGVAPPVALFEAKDLAPTYWAHFPALLRNTQGWSEGMKQVVRGDLVSSVPFWEGLLASLPALSAEERSTVLWGLATRPVTVPESTGRKWMDVLVLPLGSNGAPPFAYEAAAKSGDPRFGEYVRQRVVTRPSGFDRVVEGLLSAMDDYTGPDRLALALEVLRDEEITRRSDFLGSVLRAGKEAPEFWPTVAKSLLQLPEPGRRRVAMAVSELVQADLPPKEHDALWPPVFAVMKSNIDRTTLWIARLAARAGDPAVVEALRSKVRIGFGDPMLLAFFQVLPEYTGPDRLAFVLEMISQPNVRVYSNAQDVLRRTLDLEYQQPGTQARMVALARDAQSPASPTAIARLAETRDRALLLELMTAQEKATSPGIPEHRIALIDAATRLHLREAIPFLLREFQEGLSAQAAKAMDDIREYHERLAKFQDWTKDADGGRKSVAALLDDPDPEIRRAAVLSIAAMGDREALPALLRIAKNEKDARVRQAALDAIERMAKTPPPAPPTPLPAMSEPR